MPKLDSDPYSYDKETGTVRVGCHDLWRLILAFRDLVERQEGHGWAHMEDWDRSFERLADAVDAGNQASSGCGPDYRMRCNLSSAYRWPKGAPYNGERGLQALCGFSFASEEAKPITSKPDCQQCRRELALVKELQVSENPGG